MNFTILKSQKNRKTQPGAKLKYDDYINLTIIGSLNLNMMIKIEFKKIKTGHRPIKDIKGYHIHFFLFSNLLIENSYDGYTIGRNLRVSS
jgi:hypothetical protein